VLCRGGGEDGCVNQGGYGICSYGDVGEMSKSEVFLWLGVPPCLVCGGAEEGQQGMSGRSGLHEHAEREGSKQPC